MPRNQSSKPNAARFYDSLSDSYLTVFYDQPTTEERIAYLNSLVNRRGAKVESNVGESRLKHGTKILRGFKEGDFTIDGVAFSSDPQSPLYRNNWKALLNQMAADVIMQLAVLVFEASVSDAPELSGGEVAPDPL